MGGVQSLSCHQQFSEYPLNSCQVTGYSFIFISYKFGIPIQFKNIYRALNISQDLCQALEPQRQRRLRPWARGFPFRKKRDVKKTKPKQTQANKNPNQINMIIVMKSVWGQGLCLNPLCILCTKRDAHNGKDSKICWILSWWVKSETLLNVSGVVNKNAFFRGNIGFWPVSANSVNVNS